MRVREPGKIRDNLWLLGREESCVYLLEGESESLIISGGMSYIIPDLHDQFDRFGIDETRIGKMLILHAHFDHVGIIPYFKRRRPGIEISASARAWEILGTPKAIETINTFSRDIARHMGRESIYTTHDPEWRDDITGITVSEGDDIDLGNMAVRIFETPGHSSCSTSAYVSALKALFPSDGVGIPYRSSTVISANSNFTRYQESLDRLKDLDVDYICADHYGCVTGDESKTFVRKSIDLAERHRAMIKKIYLRIGDIDATAKKMVAIFYRRNKDYFLNPSIFEGIYRQMVRHIASSLEG
jgi:glyoxylase-like metal-dependent hydrolase (beta-lactamase superfamily II)